MRDRFLKRLLMVALVVITAAPGLLGQLAKVRPQQISDRLIGITNGAMTTIPGPEAAPQLDARHRQHLLYGDAHGGGHLHGTGSPCKSEFPAGWSADDIIGTVTAAAANDNLPWRHQANGYDVADTVEKGVKIRIVVNRPRGEIITAYPLDTPRNPCPAANDNDE